MSLRAFSSRRLGFGLLGTMAACAFAVSVTLTVKEQRAQADCAAYYVPWPTGAVCPPGCISNYEDRYCAESIYDGDGCEFLGAGPCEEDTTSTRTLSMADCDQSWTW